MKAGFLGLWTTTKVKGKNEELLLRDHHSLSSRALSAHSSMPMIFNPEKKEGGRFVLLVGACLSFSEHQDYY
jgi:hypothetical protein